MLSFQTTTTKNQLEKLSWKCQFYSMQLRKNKNISVNFILENCLKDMNKICRKFTRRSKAVNEGCSIFIVQSFNLKRNWWTPWRRHWCGQVSFMEIVTVLCSSGDGTVFGVCGGCGLFMSRMLFAAAVPSHVCHCYIPTVSNIVWMVMERFLFL